MKRPLIPVALLYSSGLLLADLTSFPLLYLFFGTACAFVAALCSPRGFWMALLFIACGWLNLTARTQIISPFDLRALIGDRAEWATVYGKLRATPSYRVYEANGEETQSTVAHLEISSLSLNGSVRPAFGTILVTTKGLLGPEIFAGREVAITGILQKPREPMAHGLFDYRVYLRRQGIYYQLTAASSNDWQITSAASREPFADRFFHWAQSVLQRGIPLQDEPMRLVWAMTLGWKTALTDETSEPFMRSGTMHIFAISGLHIALIAGILVALLRVLQTPRGACAFIVIPLIWFYTHATGWQPSAVRSTIMMTIIVAGWSLKRPTDLLNSLAASALIILLWDPRQLFQASFQLSFFVVLSIALLMPGFQAVRDRWLRPDPFLPDELRPLWQRRLDLPLRWATTAFATSLAAWLGSLPLTAFYFHLVTPISLAANFLIVPLSALALMSNLGSLICGTWLLSLGTIFNHAGWFFMHLMVEFSQWFASLPGAYRYVPSPGLIECIIFYALLFTLLNGWWKQVGQRRVVTTIAIIAVGLVVWNWHKAARQVTVSILPVEGGEAIFVDAFGRSDDLLIDCGNERTSRTVVIPFLRSQGVNRLHSLLLTHGDLKHIGGYSNVFAELKPDRVITSAASFRSPAYRAIIASLTNQTIRWKQVDAGDSLDRWTVLHPSAHDDFGQADDKALVLFGSIQGHRVLFLSDLGRAGQEKMLTRHPTLSTDVVVAGIPLQSEPVLHPLLKALQPKLSIITDSEFPATERASRKLKTRLTDSIPHALFTRETRSIQLIFLRKEMWADPLDGAGFSVSEPRLSPP